MVDKVQELQNYILHLGQVEEGTVKVGEKVTLSIDKVSLQRRVGTFLNNYTS